MTSKCAAAAAALALAACSPAGQTNGQNSDAPATTVAAQRPSDADSEAYMRQAEADWAALAVKPMPGLLNRILADDYVAVSSKGDVRDKAQQVKLDAPDPAFVASRLDTLHYRHFGDTVIAQGGETLTGHDAKDDVSLIWTDVWMWRNGTWQLVASQDSVLPKKK